MMMVFYRLADYRGVPTAECRFIEPRDDNDRELIKSINREIEEHVPAEDRRYYARTESWEVTRDQWSLVSAVIRENGLTPRERYYQPDGFRSNTRALAYLTWWSALPISLILLLNVMAHFFQARGLAPPVRPFLFLAFLLLTFVSFRFGQHLQGAVASCLVIAFNPFETFYIPNWYVWQLFNWVSLAFLFVSGARSSMAADRELKLDQWWIGIKD